MGWHEPCEYSMMRTAMDKESRGTPTEPANSDSGPVTIYIDQNGFTLSGPSATGLALRQVPIPPLTSDLDLFRIEQSADYDTLVGNDEVVELHEGDRFFTVPQRILAG